MMSGVIASTFLGLTIGIYAKNQQAATGLSMPFAMIFGFVPMVAGFNEPMIRFTRFMYTQQIELILGNAIPGIGYQPDMSLWESFGVIGLNVVFMATLFVIAFTKKGLRS
jgi:ABC-2 type transport system permease protein